MAVVELTEPPSLARLYARAALGAVPLLERVPGVPGLGRGMLPARRDPAVLPDTRYRLAARPVDREHLAAYQRVCGFGIGDALPATYLHVLAFPVTMALMSEPGFPFPLVGLVHLANSITVRRPVAPGEAVAFDVRAADLRDHPAGRVVDLVVEADVDGEPVWSGRSSYLRRGGSPSAREPRVDATADAGERRPASLIRVGEDVGRRYAAVSGDRNPIHLHPLAARAFGFRSAIAHGMWLHARVLAALAGRVPERAAIDVAFRSPVLLPSTVALTATAAGGGWDLELRSVRDGRPHLTGTVRRLQ